MSMSSAAPESRTRAIILWVLKIVFVLLFLGAGGAKLFGVPQMVAEFNQIGLGDGFRYFTGITEIGGAILLLVPRTSVYGAFLLAAVCVGAFLAQILVIHQDFIHTIVMGAILGVIAWMQRHTLPL